jgi:SAM-dependent methyltransferase
MKKLIKQVLKSGYTNLVKVPYLNLTQIYYSNIDAPVECNICNYKAMRLKSDEWHLYCICPRCDSAVRSRLLIASLKLLDNFNIDKIINKKRVLHFAPEKPIEKKFREKAAVYKTADLFTGGNYYSNIDYNIDISNMKAIENGSFDVVVALDVLEHVPNHIDAIKEVYRVLELGGFCIFTVPQKDNLQTTFEDPSVIDPKERTRLFGQEDHVRIYGDDFEDILKSCGFEVTAVNETYFDEALVKKHVLFPPILSERPLATNYRKVFFGKKA